MTTPPIEEFVCSHAELPRALEMQIWDFTRLIWGDGWSNETKFRTRMFDDPAPLHFVRAAGDLLVSHAQVVSFAFDVGGRELRIGGVGAVLTFPQFRGEGHATALMRRAAIHIRDTAELGMLFCSEENAPFYGRLGWATLPHGRVLLRGVPRDDVVMVLGDPDLVPAPFPLDRNW
jgi:predicted acetyltransferase